MTIVGVEGLIFELHRAREVVRGLNGLMEGMTNLLFLAKVTRCLLDPRTIKGRRSKKILTGLGLFLEIDKWKYVVELD